MKSVQVLTTVITIIKSHQPAKITGAQFHKEASQNCSFRGRMIGIYSATTSKQVLKGYPGLTRDSFAGKLRARDVRPLQTYVVAPPAHVHIAVFTLINMPHYFLPQMGGRRICVRKVQFTQTVYLKIGISSTHARTQACTSTRAQHTYRNIRYGNTTNKCT